MRASLLCLFLPLLCVALLVVWPSGLAANDVPTSPASAPGTPAAPAPTAAAPRVTADRKKLAATIGRVVLYLLPRGSGMGQTRPAIITRVNGATNVNLQVLMDGPNDPHDPTTMWVGSANHDQAGKSLGTWRWPDIVDPKPTADDAG